MSKKNIAVLGAGKMGLGIAQLFATKGHQVKVIYVYDDKIRCDAAAVVRSNLSVLVENDVMTQQEADDAAARISFVDTIEEVADFADIVFEGIIEKLEIKQDYFAKMDAIFPVSTILATNTSAISITEIAEKSVHKERIIGTRDVRSHPHLNATCPGTPLSRWSFSIRDISGNTLHPADNLLLSLPV